MVDYNNFGGSGGNSGNSEDSERNPTLKITPYATIEGTLEKVFPSGSSYGQSLASVWTDVELVDGAVYDRGDGTYKVFGWPSLGFTDEMEFTGEDAPRVNSETFGSNSYSYELIGARADDYEPDSDNFELGDVIIFDGASQQYGPNSASKTAARTLTDLGRDAIISEDDYESWLDSSLSIRDDLEGMRIRHFRTRKDGRENKFTLPVYINVALDEQITIDNRVKATPEATAATDGGQQAEVKETAATTAATEFAAPVQEFIEFCREEGITEESAIVTVMDTSVGNDATELTGEMVNGLDTEIIAAIQN